MSVINIMSINISKQLPVLGENVVIGVSVQEGMTFDQCKERIDMAYKIIDERCSLNNKKAQELLEEEAKQEEKE